MNIALIKSFSDALNVSIEEIDQQYHNRITKQVKVGDIIYVLCQMFSNNMSFETVSVYLRIDKILNVSNIALINAKNKIHYSDFDKLNNDLIHHIYKNNKSRLLAVDGSRINLSKLLHNEGFKFGTNNQYCYGLMSSIHDIEHDIPINYTIFKNIDEREALKNQLIYLHEGDILIMDRGYYSKEMLALLTEHNIKTMFRLKEEHFEKYLVDEPNNCTKMITIIFGDKEIQFKLIRYMVGEDYHYLGTTIYGKIFSYYVDLYRKRWQIETHFKHSKYDLSLKDLKSITENGIRQDVAIHQFICIVSFYFKSALEKTIDHNYKLRSTTFLSVIPNRIIYLLFYESDEENIFEAINEILNELIKTKTKVRPNRSFPRITNKPYSKWSKNGVKHAKPKKNKVK
jgi:hypothetical protein